MSIYTKTGDSGKTSLFGGSRISKDNLRVECYGCIDEIVSELGLAYARLSEEKATHENIRTIQKNLFTLGAQLASDAKGAAMLKDVICEADIAFLESIIDNYHAKFGAIREFTIPGANVLSAQLHVARTVARRAERRIVALAEIKDENIDNILIKYVNRLSDALFIMAKEAEREEPKKEKKIKFEYKEASRKELEMIWEKNIADNAGDERWIAWRDICIAENAEGKCKTFIVSADGKPIGEGGLLFSPSCSAISERTDLANGESTANINALRIDPKYEGQGHISKLVGLMEKYAAEHGYTRLTIGVEPKESRNISIYFHWGYTEFVRYDIEHDESLGLKNLVLYYGKNL
ncbi:MAG: cob(I)yrinic acid a,c-diamide adenosyltransferase [Defluviitaleaceae bacterium]|nr:cob(I)yrinic acid a,c-diamide adenosyltransferase [Defluviitaleaceae bacterium]